MLSRTRRRNYCNQLRQGCSSSSQLMNNICGYAPYTKLHLLGDEKRVVKWVFRHEVQRITNGEKPFDRKFTVDQSNDDGVLPCIKGTIYYQHITLAYSGSFHGVA